MAELIDIQINKLEKIADEIEISGITILKETPLFREADTSGVLSTAPKNRWEPIPTNSIHIQRKAVQDYQRFYSMGLVLVKEFLPEKEDEFVSCYEVKKIGHNGIIDYLQLRKSQYSNDKNKIIKNFTDLLDIQKSILMAIPDIASIKEIKLREIIVSDFVDCEIEEAEVLLKNNHFRAAGAIAGVALEQHLRMLCIKYQIDYHKKDTLGPLITKLYDAKRIDITQMKLLQYLSDIRNKCDHPGEIKKEEVKELIERTKKFTSEKI